MLWRQKSVWFSGYLTLELQILWNRVCLFKEFHYYCKCSWHLSFGQQYTFHKHFLKGAVKKIHFIQNMNWDLPTGCLKKTLWRFNPHFLSYYLVNLHIQHHFLNPHDLSFSKHPQLLSLDQPKAEKIEENHREARNNKPFTATLADF